MPRLAASFLSWWQVKRKVKITNIFQRAAKLRRLDGDTDFETLKEFFEDREAFFRFCRTSGVDIGDYLDYSPMPMPRDWMKKRE